MEKAKLDFQVTMDLQEVPENSERREQVLWYIEEIRRAVGP